MMTNKIALFLLRTFKTGVLLGISVFFDSAFADTLLTQKRQFITKDFLTTSGEVLPEVQIGWESYGTLNAEKDNVILITHYFSGNSHAAGKYAESDPRAGYWDAIIGPGKAIDTNKFFVISSDTLVNANVNNPNVYTTGPSSINPKTNKPYGLSFPVVTIRDFVNVQHALLKSLSITKLHAVVGASMGSFQALEWSSAYPDMVSNVIAVVTAGEVDSYVIAELESWASAIKADPNWNNGDYYGKPAPIVGLETAMASITLTGHSAHILDRRFKKMMTRDPEPRKSILSPLAVNTWLKAASQARAKMVDANSILYLVRANQLYRIGHQETLAEGIAPIKARILLLPSKYDVLIPAHATQALYSELLVQKKNVIYEEIEGPWGHIDAIFAIGTKAKEIKGFLEN